MVDIISSNEYLSANLSSRTLSVSETCVSQRRIGTSQQLLSTTFNSTVALQSRFSRTLYNGIGCPRAARTASFRCAYTVGGQTTSHALHRLRSHSSGSMRMTRRFRTYYQRGQLIRPTSHNQPVMWRRLLFDAHAASYSIQNDWWDYLATKTQLCTDIGDYRGFYEALKAVYGPIHQVQFRRTGPSPWQHSHPCSLVRALPNPL